MTKFRDLIYKKQNAIEDGFGALALVVMLTVFIAIFILLSY